MAGKKKSPKASSKKPAKTKEVAATTPKDEETNLKSSAKKSKQNNKVAKSSYAKSKSVKTDRYNKDKSDKNKSGKKGAAVKQFFKDLKNETKKVVWNTKEDTLKSTGVVLLVVILVGIGIWLVDFGLTSLREYIYQLSKSNAQEANIMLSMMLSGLM